jgi:hypothetical protein
MISYILPVLVAAQALFGGRLSRAEVCPQSEVNAKLSQMSSGKENLDYGSLTGATDTSLARSFIEHVGLERCGAIQIDGLMESVEGRATACRAHLEQISLGTPRTSHIWLDVSMKVQRLERRVDQCCGGVKRPSSAL